ncbi:MAG: HAMP domain-containing histidine kinase [Agathobacter sp.]|nr:HAMP domain-containing histidine kinase [Agathobacter sp.]
MLCFISAQWIIWGISRQDYYPGISVFFALGMAALLVRLEDWPIRRVDRVRDPAEYVWKLERLRRMALRAGVGYLAVVSCLLFVPLGELLIFRELADYRDLRWVVPAILFLPILSFALPLYYRADKRLSELIWKLQDQSLSREALMAELEEKMKDAVEERVKSERMKIDLITNVSHDLKTPLTSVIGYIELMKKEENSETMRDYLEVLTRKTDILRKMIENVFELAKASSGSAPLNLGVLDVNRLVRQVLADCDGNIRQRGDHVKIDLAEGAAEVLADSVYLYRIVQNLIENACKYALDGTRIFIRTRVREGRVSLELINVSAYPIDFEPEEIKERFVRGDASRSTEGNGLGLAIVETYTNALGGRFDIVIEGDTFKALVSFPLAVGSEKGEEQSAEGIPI